MEQSSFLDPGSRPDESSLGASLGDSYGDWVRIVAFVFKEFTGVKEEWNYSRAGWNVRLKEKKRAIVYMMPGESRFRVSMVFGGKATNLVRESGISASVLQIIEDAPVYGEGRGFRVVVPDQCGIEDTIKLIEIKKMF